MEAYIQVAQILELTDENFIVNVIDSRKKEKLICMERWEILVEKQITTRNQMKKLKIEQNIRIKNSFNGLKSRLEIQKKK